MAIPDVGKLGRAKPKFSRPSIDLSRHDREWLDVAASTLKKGDIVPGVGVLEHDPSLEGREMAKVTLYGPERVVQVGIEESVRAFVPRLRYA